MGNPSDFIIPAEHIEIHQAGQGEILGAGWMGQAPGTGAFVQHWTLRKGYVRDFHELLRKRKGIVMRANPTPVPTLAAWRDTVAPLWCSGAQYVVVSGRREPLSQAAISPSKAAQGAPPEESLGGREQEYDRIVSFHPVASEVLAPIGYVYTHVGGCDKVHPPLGAGALEFPEVAGLHCQRRMEHWICLESTPVDSLVFRRLPSSKRQSFNKDPRGAVASVATERASHIACACSVFSELPPLASL